MKHLLAPILLLTLLFPSFALGETMDDLVKRNGLHYKKYTEVPFTGKTTGQMQITFKDGKMEGPFVLYYKNGHLFEKGTYKNGKKDGPWVQYWSNGQLISKGTYKNGKREGPWMFYDWNGQKNLKGKKFGNRFLHEGTGTYKNGVKVK